jgi:L-fucose mutarotase
LIYLLTDWRARREPPPWEAAVLIGIPPLLGPDLLYALRAMGHGDEIALVDGNYPAQEHARRLVRADGHGVLPLIEAILSVLPLDRAVPNAIFRAVQNNDPSQSTEFHRAVDALFARLAPGMAVKPLAGSELYARIKAAHTVVATSEPALFGNVILRKGVVAPARLNGPPQRHR